MRHVYILDVEDIEECFDHKFDKEQLKRFFKEGAWLRSAYSGDSYACWFVDGYYESVIPHYCDTLGIVRPVFTVDLSKIKWEKMDNGIKI